jgi:hypothetical protein
MVPINNIFLKYIFFLKINNSEVLWESNPCTGIVQGRIQLTVDGKVKNIEKKSASDQEN